LQNNIYDVESIILKKKTYYLWVHAYVFKSTELVWKDIKVVRLDTSWVGRKMKTGMRRPTTVLAVSVMY
jgi:hypothetical protein